jgi:hypothetical protein
MYGYKNLLSYLKTTNFFPFLSSFLLFWIGMEKKSGSGINIPDPQYCEIYEFTTLKLDNQ